MYLSKDIAYNQCFSKTIGNKSKWGFYLYCFCFLKATTTKKKQQQKNRHFK